MRSDFSSSVGKWRRRSLLNFWEFQGPLLDFMKIDTALLYAPERGIYENTTKTGNVRFLNLPAETMALLREYRLWYLEQRLKNGDRWQDAGFVFVRDDGRPMNPDSIWSWLQKFSKRHGLPHINPHAFRRAPKTQGIKKDGSPPLGLPSTFATFAIFCYYKQHLIFISDFKAYEDFCYFCYFCSLVWTWWTPVFLGLCAKCAPKQNGRLLFSYKKLEKHPEIRKFLGVSWYGRRDSNPRPTDS